MVFLCSAFSTVGLVVKSLSRNAEICGLAPSLFYCLSCLLRFSVMLHICLIHVVIVFFVINSV